LQRDAAVRMEYKPLVTGSGLALGACERILLMRLRMKEYRKILADRRKAARHHIIRRRADHNMIAILHRQAEQVIAHRAADDIGFHAECIPYSASTSYLGMCSVSAVASSTHCATAGCRAT